MRRLAPALLLLFACTPKSPPPVLPTGEAPATEPVAEIPPAAAPAARTPPAWHAQLPPIIDREIFFDDPELSGAQLSPDGRFISFVKTYKGKMNVWVKKREEPFDAARPITADTERSVTGYFWSRDGKWVLWVQDKGGDENYHVYAADPAAAADAATGVPPARDLTPFPKVRAAIYAVPKRAPREILVGLNDRDPQVHDVYKLELATGKRTLVIKNTESIAGWVADLTGAVRLGLRVTPEGTTEILRVDGQKLTKIYSCTAEESCGPTRFHKDGKRVYFESNKGEFDRTRLLLLDPKTGKETLVEEDPEKQVDFGGARFSEATDELIATFYDADRLRIYPRDKQFARDYELVKKALPEGDVYFGSATADDRFHIVAVTSDTDPGATYLYDRKTGKVELQYRPYPKLPVEHLARMKPVRYQARDGLEIPAYLTVPKGIEAKGLPAIVLPHGGPWYRDSWGYDPFAQFLANRGYVVLQPNFRGSTGYGKKFLNLGNKQWGTGTMQHDVTDGAGWLASQGVADAKQICIMGGSYGGYATLAGLAFTPDVYACGVDIVGPSNLFTLLASVPPYWKPIIAMFHVRMGNPDDPKDQEKLREQSPLFSARAIRRPLLVIQGANDPRVNKAEADQIVVALRDLGRPVEYLVAPDEGHGFLNRENRIAMFVAIEKFLAKHLPGRVQESVPSDIAQKLAAITVDPRTVKLAAPAKIEAKEAAFDGTALAPATLKYAQHAEAMGKKFDLTSELTIKAEGASWVIVEETKSPMGSGTETTWLDKATLLPTRRVIDQGQAHVEMTFADGSVKGEIKAGGQQMPVDAKVEGRVHADGLPLYLGLSTMKLEPGATAAVRTFDLMGGKEKKAVAAVKAVEDVKVPAGSFSAVRVTLTPADGSAADTVWIERAAPHRVVRYEVVLPAQMGGGKVLGELSK